MDLTDLSPFRVDTAYLHGKDKARFRFYPLALVEPLLCGLKFLFKLSNPFGMGKIAGPKDPNPFFLCPFIKLGNVHAWGGSARISGVYMEVRNNFHKSPFLVTDVIRYLE